MRFTSTRNKKLNVGFEQAIRDCMPEDGGLYVPAEVNDLRRWILFTNEKTTYASVAGALTLACVNEEFSPIICEAIAAQAFPYEPKLSKLDKGLYTLELFHGPTGWHRDFGVSYLIEALENILLMKDTNAVILDVNASALAASLANALRGKKRIKAVLLFPKNSVKGLSAEDFIWNGGNLFPIEIDGNIEDCNKIVKDIFSDHKNVENLNLTVANTANIGRLFPQAFFYPFAFSRLKREVTGNIYYAMPPGNFSNVTAGLYSWKIAMPVSGFILPATDALTVDPAGRCVMLDALVPVNERGKTDPSCLSNLERLEEIFSANTALMHNLVYAAKITDDDTVFAAKELFMKYHLYADKNTASAYAAALKQKGATYQDNGTLVLVVNDHPSLDADFIRRCTGENLQVPENVAASVRPANIGKPLIRSSSEVLSIARDVSKGFTAESF